jgi:hypothetical protein
MADDLASEVDHELERAAVAKRRAEALRDQAHRVVLETQAAREAHRRLRALINER